MFVPYKEIELTVAGSSTPHAAVSFSDIRREISDIAKSRGFFAIISAVSADMIVKFGDNSVAADAALGPDFRRLAGNFTCRNGAVLEYGVDDDDTHLSVIPRDEATGGTLIVTFGYGSES